jgi:O-antigen/teichoic acid export membrane protein
MRQLRDEWTALPIGIERLKARLKERLAASPELARTSAKSVGIRAVGAIFGFAFNIVLARSLGVAGTGVAMFYLNFASLIGLIATGGTDVVGLRELSRHADDVSRGTIVLGHLITNALMCTLAFSLGGFLFLWLLGGWLTGHISFWLDAICVLTLFLTACQKISSDWLVALKEFAASQLVFYFINRVTSLGLAMVLLALAGTIGVTPERFVGLYAVGLSFAVLYAFRHIFAHFAWHDTVHKLSPAMPLFRDGVTCAIQNTAFILLSLSPFVLLGAVSGTSELALFGVSQRLVAIIVLALTTISQFAMRDLSQAFGYGDFGRFARDLTVSFRLTFIASIVLTIPLVMFAPFWVLVFGKGFAGAAPVLAVLSIGICAQCLGMPFQAALFATNNERPARNVTLICAVVGIVVNVFLVLACGALGAAIGTGIGLALQSLGHAACVLRILPVRLEFAVLRLAARPVAAEY